MRISDWSSDVCSSDLHAVLAEALAGAGIPADAVQLVPTTDRAAVGAMLQAAGLIDMIVPRGGKSLVARVQAEARVPELAPLDGINHPHVHSSENGSASCRASVRQSV